MTLYIGSILTLKKWRQAAAPFSNYIKTSYHFVHNSGMESQSVVVCHSPPGSPWHRVGHLLGNQEMWHTCNLQFFSFNPFYFRHGRGRLQSQVEWAMGSSSLWKPQQMGRCRFPKVSLAFLAPEWGPGNWLNQCPCCLDAKRQGKHREPMPLSTQP